MEGFRGERLKGLGPSTFCMASSPEPVPAMEEHAREAREDQRAKRERAERKTTVRELGQEWLEWLEQVRGAKPSTIRDHACLLRAPGIAYKRGERTTVGRIVAAFGDRPIDAVTRRR